MTKPESTSRPGLEREAQPSVHLHASMLGMQAHVTPHSHLPARSKCTQTRLHKIRQAADKLLRASLRLLNRLLARGVGRGVVEDTIEEAEGEEQQGQGGGAARQQLLLRGNLPPSHQL